MDKRKSAKTSAANAGTKASNIKNLRRALCLPQVWVYATKKIPSENENSGFGFDLFSFLHRDFSSFTSGCPVLVKEDDPEKTA